MDSLSIILSPRTRLNAVLRWAITALPIVFLFVGCAVPGQMSGREPYKITDVTVRLTPGLGATPAFSSRLKSAMLETAALWSMKGRDKRVVLSISRYRIYRPGRVLMHDDGSLANGNALVVDKVTGQTDAVVEVIGEVRHTVGATGRSWAVNTKIEESGIATALAEDLMLKLRGAAASRTRESVPSAERLRPRDPVDGPVNARLPATPQAKWDHGGEMTCLAALNEALSSEWTGRRMPPHCRAMGYRLPEW